MVYVDRFGSGSGPSAAARALAASRFAYLPLLSAKPSTSKRVDLGDNMGVSINPDHWVLWVRVDGDLYEIGCKPGGASGDWFTPLDALRVAREIKAFGSEAVEILESVGEVYVVHCARLPWRGSIIGKTWLRKAMVRGGN